LENEGIWVDAAMYGNLSRYINHASEHDKKACNITPKVMWVNNEFRIKFSALRDIRAGEELFFNYGEYFPNLTKKLLEGEEDKPNGGKAKRNTGGKPTKTNPAAKGKARKTAPRLGEDDPMDWTSNPLLYYDDDVADEWESSRRRPKKRGGRRPGAGRKKKVTIATDANGGTSDSQGDSPTNGRKKTQGPGASDSDTGNASKQNTAPVKKVSKRGGARPGAGRKPKHPKPAPPQTERNVEVQGSIASHGNGSTL
jgi:hypothetical protein